MLIPRLVVQDSYRPPKRLFVSVASTHCVWERSSYHYPLNHTEDFIILSSYHLNHVDSFKVVKPIWSEQIISTREQAELHTKNRKGAKPAYSHQKRFFFGKLDSVHIRVYIILWLHDTCNVISRHIDLHSTYSSMLLFILKSPSPTFILLWKTIFLFTTCLWSMNSLDPLP